MPPRNPRRREKTTRNLKVEQNRKDAEEKRAVSDAAAAEAAASRTAAEAAKAANADDKDTLEATAIENEKKAENLSKIARDAETVFKKSSSEKKAREFSETARNPSTSLEEKKTSFASAIGELRRYHQLVTEELRVTTDELAAAQNQVRDADLAVTAARDARNAARGKSFEALQAYNAAQQAVEEAGGLGITPDAASALIQTAEAALATSNAARAAAEEADAFLTTTTQALHLANEAQALADASADEKILRLNQEETKVNAEIAAVEAELAGLTTRPPTPPPTPPAAGPAVSAAATGEYLTDDDVLITMFARNELKAIMDADFMQTEDTFEQYYKKNPDTTVPSRILAKNLFIAGYRYLTNSKPKNTRKDYKTKFDGFGEIYAKVFYYYMEAIDVVKESVWDPQWRNHFKLVKGINYKKRCLFFAYEKAYLDLTAAFVYELKTSHPTYLWAAVTSRNEKLKSVDSYVTSFAFHATPTAPKKDFATRVFGLGGRTGGTRKHRMTGGAPTAEDIALETQELARYEASKPSHLGKIKIFPIMTRLKELIRAGTYKTEDIAIWKAMIDNQYFLFVQSEDMMTQFRTMLEIHGKRLDENETSFEEHSEAMQRKHAEYDAEIATLKLCCDKLAAIEKSINGLAEFKTDSLQTDANHSAALRELSGQIVQLRTKEPELNVILPRLEIIEGRLRQLFPGLLEITGPDGAKFDNILDQIKTKVSSESFEASNAELRGMLAERPPVDGAESSVAVGDNSAALNALREVLVGQIRDLDTAIQTKLSQEDRVGIIDQVNRDLNGRFETLIEAINERITSSFQPIQAKLQVVLNQIPALVAGITNLENKPYANADVLTALSGTVETLTGRLEDITAKVTALESSSASSSEEISSVEQIAALEASIAAHTAELNELKTRIDAMQAIIATLSDDSADPVRVAAAASAAAAAAADSAADSGKYPNSLQVRTQLYPVNPINDLPYKSNGSTATIRVEKSEIMNFCKQYIARKQLHEWYELSHDFIDSNKYGLEGYKYIVQKVPALVDIAYPADPSKRVEKQRQFYLNEQKKVLKQLPELRLKRVEGQKPSFFSFTKGGKLGRGKTRTNPYRNDILSNNPIVKRRETKQRPLRARLTKHRKRRRGGKTKHKKGKLLLNKKRTKHAVRAPSKTRRKPKKPKLTRHR